MNFFTYYSIVVLVGLVFLTAGCNYDDDGLVEIYCAPFIEEEREYFPQRIDDVIIFTGEDSTEVEDRRFQVSREVVIADTTLETLFENTVCDPYVDLFMDELEEPRTFLGVRITNLLSTEESGTALSVNFTDSNFTGSSFVRIVIIDENDNLTGGTGTEATAIDSLVVNGQLYEDVIRLSMITPPDFSNNRFNDVREIWLAPGVGMVRFRDEERGVFNRE